MPIITLITATSSAFALANAPSQLPYTDQQALHDIAASISATNIEKDITELVSFGTRHTLSETESDTRGIGAARRWIKAVFDKISA